MISYGAEARFIAGTALAQRIASAGHVAEITGNHLLSTAGGIGIRNAMPETAPGVKLDVHGNEFRSLGTVTQGTRISAFDNVIEKAAPVMPASKTAAGSNGNAGK
jgi:hypothetical protein